MIDFETLFLFCCFYFSTHTTGIQSTISISSPKQQKLYSKSPQNPSDENDNSPNDDDNK
jgi:hypothetical protein